MHWAVTVELDGEKLVTIESDCLSGKGDLSNDELEVVRNAAEHLLGFAGRERTPEPMPWAKARPSDLMDARQAGYHFYGEGARAGIRIAAYPGCASEDEALQKFALEHPEYILPF